VIYKAEWTRIMYHSTSSKIQCMFLLYIVHCETWTLLWLFMNWVPCVLSWRSPVIPLLMDSVCVLYNAVNKSISCSRVFIPVGEGQANEDLQLSFPAYYLLPPSVSSVTFYESCSESNAPHFFSQKLFIRNVWNSRTV
jgi:hypothetical protein